MEGIKKLLRESGADCQTVPLFAGDEPKSGFARELGDRLQSWNMPFGASGDLYI